MQVNASSGSLLEYYLELAKERSAAAASGSNGAAAAGFATIMSEASSDKTAMLAAEAGSSGDAGKASPNSATMSAQATPPANTVETDPKDLFRLLETETSASGTPGGITSRESFFSELMKSYSSVAGQSGFGFSDYMQGMIKNAYGG